MGYRPTSKLEWTGLWSLFILPATHGCIVWIRQPVFPIEHAYISWLFAAAFAVILMDAYHHRTPDDQDEE
jgi:hypothetical protein